MKNNKANIVNYGLVVVLVNLTLTGIPASTIILVSSPFLILKSKKKYINISMLSLIICDVIFD